MLMAPMVQYLITHFSYVIAFRMLAGISLLLSLCGLFYLKPNEDYTDSVFSEKTPVNGTNVTLKRESDWLEEYEINRASTSLPLPKDRKVISVSDTTLMKPTKFKNFGNSNNSTNAKNVYNFHNSFANKTTTNNKYNTTNINTNNITTSHIRRTTTKKSISLTALQRLESNSTFNYHDRKSLRKTQGPNSVFRWAKKKFRTKRKKASVNFGRHFARPAASMLQNKYRFCHKGCFDVLKNCCWPETNKIDDIRAPQKLPPSKSIVFELLKNRVFIFILINSFLVFFSYDIPLLNITDLAQKKGVSVENSAYLLSAFGITNSVAQVRGQSVLVSLIVFFNGIHYYPFLLHLIL